MIKNFFLIILTFSIVYINISHSIACPVHKFESSLNSLSYGTTTLYMNTKLLVEIGDQRVSMSELFDSKGHYLPSSAINIEQYTETDSDNRFFLWKLVFPKKLNEPINYMIISPNPNSMINLFQGMDPLLLYYKINIKNQYSTKKISGKFLVYPNQIGCPEIKKTNQ